MHTRDIQVPQIRLRVAQFDQLCMARGLVGATHRADYLGVRRTTVSRLQHGVTRPGERFIAATLAAFPGTAFEDLYEVVSGPAPSDVPAHAHNAKNSG